MVRIKKMQDGSIRVLVNGAEVALPDRGKDLVLTPQISFNPRIENPKK